MAEDNIISEDESGPRPVARQTEFSVTFARERKKSTSKMPDGRTCLVLECSGRSFDNIRGLQEHIWDDHVIWKGEARGKRGRACVFPSECKSFGVDGNAIENRNHRDEAVFKICLSKYN